MFTRGVKMNKAWTFGRDVNTDEIVPARYLNTSDPDELAQHLMEDNDNKEFKDHYKSGGNSIKGDFFAADENFGCGSSREHSPIAIKAAGIEYVIAPTFARIFYRNAFNIGLIAIECPEADKIKQGDDLEVMLDKGIIKNNTQDTEYKFKPIPKFMQKMTEVGGVMAYRAEQMGYHKK